MSNECLLTKLKGVATDDTLEKLGVISVNVDSTQTENYLISQIKFSKAVTLKAYGGQFVRPYNQAVLLGDAYDIPANSFSYFETQLGVAMNVDLPEKYSITQIFAGNAHNMQAEDFAFSSGLESISGLGIRGDISKLGDLQNLHTISFNYSTIVINAEIFADATKFVALQTLTLTYCPNVTNKTNDVKTAIEAAHPGITISW